MINKRLTFILFLLATSVLLTQAQENNALLCSDGIDNDGDGLIDCDDDECVSIPNFGCATCTTGLSFADVVIDYQSGCPAIDQNPEGAIGVADYWGNNFDEPEFVFLGEGGFIKLGFTDNLISNSGDNQDDVFVFEVGPAVESTMISLRPQNAFTENQLIMNGIPDTNGDGFYFISDIGGATSALDIDAILTGYPSGSLLFDAIELMDVDDMPCTPNTPGADIDAVCAIYSVDCNGVQNGTAVLDACDECLELSDPNFNQSCADCLGIPDGLAVLDECGDCYLPDDPNFNSGCTDCLGVVNGTAIIDECGDCLQPDDPNFNQSCIDCLGTPNGEAIIDECGDCYLPNDPEFNMACADCQGTANGLAVLDECGDCYLPDDPNFNSGCTDCLGIVNGTAIIDECGDCLQPDDPIIDQSCIDCLGTPNGNAIIDECGDCYLPDDPNFNLECSDCEGIPNGTATFDTCGVCLRLDDELFNLTCFECEIFIPNVFTPDEEMNNDYFKIYTCQDYKIDITKFIIFDRWGNRMYEQKTSQSINDFVGWDGNYNNEKLNPGVFTYIIEIVNHVNKVTLETGTVTLLR